MASEDLTLAATGVLVAQGKLTFASGVAACVAGIFAGDMLLYLAGRAFGTGIGRWALTARLVERLVPAHMMAEGGTWLSRRGMSVVLLSRFTPGLRLPTYFAAGLLPTSIGAFAGYFLVAALVWTPLFVGTAGWFSSTLLGRLFGGGGGPSGWGFAVAFGAVAGAAWLIRKAVAERRRLAGFVKRKLRWEFWPPWAAYLPLVPYFLFLAIRHRSLTVFTAANPCMPGGGFVGESKIAILRDLEQTAAEVGEFALVGARLTDDAERAAIALGVAERSGWPVVLKPDVGERGAGVAIVRSVEEIERYLRANPGNTIVQSYLPGLEFGIFYYRFPGQERGRVFSITEKRFPHVTGDGRRSLRELILNDTRAVCAAAAYIRAARRDPDATVTEGEQVQLVEIGSHCRGAVFLDGGRYLTAELAAAVDRICVALPGFHFGRFDVRSDSIADLRAGRFRVIELNGVSAEATHIYDPAVSIRQAYGTMFEQWRIAFAIGAANRKLGVKPASAMEVLRSVWGRWRNSGSRANRPERDRLS